jgi:hypothetical protein
MTVNRQMLPVDFVPPNDSQFSWETNEAQFGSDAEGAIVDENMMVRT